MSRESLRVELDRRDYEIVVGDGVMADAAGLIAPLLRRPRVFVVTDENVAGHHLTAFRAALEGGGIACSATVLPPGEQTKDFAHLEQLTGALLDAGAERGDMLVALGGGVIGDLTGFAAAILRRGMDFIQVPTTLLAQVDSSVGGKTGIDTRHGKNLIGAFHQPRLVLADTAVLETLPRRELLAGYAEVAKYGLLGDAALFDGLERHGAEVIAGGSSARREAVMASCRAKAAIVARDETEAGERALLNLGHTFGHALEAETGFGGRLLHGEAVAIGMVMAFGLSNELGLCQGQDALRARRHLAAVGLPTHPADLGLGDLVADRLVDRMAQDKKVVDGQITFVLVHGIGRAFLTREVAPDSVRAYLANFLSRRPDAA